MKKAAQERRGKVIPLEREVTVLNTRVRKKKKKKKRKGFWTKPRVIFIMAAVIVLCMCFLPVFNLESIVVEGNVNTPEEEVLRAVSVQEGNNIFRISARKIRNNVSTLPYVESVKVKRKLPATLVVRVTEHEPIYQMAYMGEYLLLSEENIALEKIPERREGMPVLTGLSPKTYRLGEPIAEAALRLITAPSEAQEQEDEPPAGAEQTGEPSEAQEQTEEPPSEQEPDASFVPEEEAGDFAEAGKEAENLLVLADQAAKAGLKGILDAGVYDKIQEIDVSNPYQIMLTYNNTLKVDIGDTENLAYKFDLMKYAIDKLQEGERGTLIVSASGRATFKPE